MLASTGRVSAPPLPRTEWGSRARPALGECQKNVRMTWCPPKRPGAAESGRAHIPQQAAPRAPRQELKSESIPDLGRNQGTEEAELPEAPRRAPYVGTRLGPMCQMFAGHPLRARRLARQRGQADPQSRILGQVEGAWYGKQEVGRGRLGAKLPLHRGNREAGCSGPVAGSDLRPKQTCLRGPEGLSLPVRMESKANRNPRGPSCDP